jgi:hypothetical protein
MEQYQLPIEVQQEIAKRALSFYASLDVLESMTLPLNDVHGQQLYHKAYHELPSQYMVTKDAILKQVTNICLANMTPYPHDFETIGTMLTYHEDEYVVVGTSGDIRQAYYEAIMVKKNSLRRDTQVGDWLYLTAKDRMVTWLEKTLDFDYSCIKISRDAITEGRIQDESHDTWGDTYAYASGWNFNA